MRRIWTLIALVVMGFVGGCGGSNQQPIPTMPLLTTTPTSTITPTRPPTPSSTPTDTPDPTPEIRAEVVLLVVDCTWKFCPPEELEQAVISVIGEPGIFTAAPIDELHVRLVYDPTQLTAEEAIELFASITSLEVEQRQNG